MVISMSKLGSFHGVSVVEDFLECKNLNENRFRDYFAYLFYDLESQLLEGDGFLGMDHEE